MSALLLVSWEKRSWALWKAKVVSRPETKWASPKAKTRDLLASQEAELNFSIQIALEADQASHAAYRCWCETNLVSIETELDLQVTFFVSSETCFRVMAREDLTTKIFLCLRKLMEPEPPSERICSNLSWSNWMTSVSTVDPRVSLSHYGTVFLLLKKRSPMESPSWFPLILNVGKLYKFWGELQVIKLKIISISLLEISGEVWRWNSGRRVTTLFHWRCERLSLRSP